MDGLNAQGLAPNSSARRASFSATVLAITLPRTEGKDGRGDGSQRLWLPHKKQVQAPKQARQCHEGPKSWFATLCDPGFQTVHVSLLPYVLKLALWWKPLSAVQPAGSLGPAS